MTTAEAVAKLDALAENTNIEPEGAHVDADAIVLAFCPTEIQEAYDRVAVAAGGWWYS